MIGMSIAETSSSLRVEKFRRMNCNKHWFGLATKNSRRLASIAGKFVPTFGSCCNQKPGEAVTDEAERIGVDEKERQWHDEQKRTDSEELCNGGGGREGSSMEFELMKPCIRDKNVPEDGTYRYRSTQQDTVE